MSTSLSSRRRGKTKADPIQIEEAKMCLLLALSCTAALLAASYMPCWFLLWSLCYLYASSFLSPHLTLGNSSRKMALGVIQILRFITTGDSITEGSDMYAVVGLCS